MSTTDCIQGKKKQIRSFILERRAGLSLEERKRASLILTERILGHQWFYLSEVILGFVSYDSEIDTGEILKEALKLGKKVYVPKVVGTDMVFLRIMSMDELTEGYKGILEPSQSAESFCYDATKAHKVLMLMPGVAFDKMGNRIGYGKGFYDRYLADKRALQLRTVGIGYQCQMVDEIPASKQDIKPYQIICV